MTVTNVPLKAFRVVDTRLESRRNSVKSALLPMGGPVYGATILSMGAVS
jgi:hypothetical protein